MDGAAALVIGIERLTALFLLAIGLSHFAAPRAWASFFAGLRDRGTAGGLVNAYVNFPLGAIILAFHWVWSGPGLLVTVLGLGWTIKGAVYYIRPELVETAQAAVADEHAWRLRAAGAAMIALGAAVFRLSLR